MKLKTTDHEIETIISEVYKMKQCTFNIVSELKELNNHVQCVEVDIWRECNKLRHRLQKLDMDLAHYKMEVYKQQKVYNYWLSILTGAVAILFLNTMF